MNQADRTVYSVKRLLGKSYSELQEKTKKWGYKVIDDQSDNMVKVNIGDKFFNPIELSAEILKELKTQSEKALNADIDQAVITVPAYFNESQRQATRDAGKLAGLDVMRIINEPTAASLAYGIEGKGSGNVLVYDLGGGTFDVSILTIEDGVFEVLATHGDTYLGGDDIDEAIVDYWMTHELKEIEINRKPLKWVAEQAKVFLSGNPTEVFVSVHEGVTLKLDYQNIVEVAQPILGKTWASVKRALKDAELKPNEISEVVLVGGSTRFPEIKKDPSRIIWEYTN